MNSIYSESNWLNSVLFWCIRTKGADYTCAENFSDFLFVKKKKEKKESKVIGPALFQLTIMNCFALIYHINQNKTVQYILKSVATLPNISEFKR